MFDKLRLAWFHETGQVWLTFERTEADTTALIRALRAKVLQIEHDDTFYDASEYEDFISGTISFRGLTFHVFSEAPGDPFSDQDFVRWSITFDYVPLESDPPHFDRYETEPASLGHMWITALTILEILKPHLYPETPALAA